MAIEKPGGNRNLNVNINAQQAIKCIHTHRYIHCWFHKQFHPYLNFTHIFSNFIPVKNLHHGLPSSTAGSPMNVTLSMPFW